MQKTQFYLYVIPQLVEYPDAVFGACRAVASLTTNLSRHSFSDGGSLSGGGWRRPDHGIHFIIVIPAIFRRESTPSVLPQLVENPYAVFGACQAVAMAKTGPRNPPRLSFRNLIPESIFCFFHLVSNFLSYLQIFKDKIFFLTNNPNILYLIKTYSFYGP